MPSAATATAPLRRTQADVDRYVQTYGPMGITPELIEQMKHDGELEIVEQKGGQNNAINNIKN